MSLTSRDPTGAVSVADSDVSMTTPLLSDQEEHQLPDGYVVGVVRGGYANNMGLEAPFVDSILGVHFI